MTAAELRTEREELCVEFGFANRWTAMIFQWVRDVFEGANHDSLEEAAEDIRAYVMVALKVPAYRLKGVDFVQIALCLGVAP